MIKVKDDDYVVAFKVLDDIWVKSYFSDMECRIDYGDTVAVLEEKLCICLGRDIYRITWDKYMQLVDKVEVLEVKYKDYLQMHRDSVIRKNPDAPVILQIDERSGQSSDSTSYSPKSVINIGKSEIRIQRY
ncbi:hypothetical protein XaC1_335 [Xanthomonas phage XaC1]|nr:hypothetical protein XaC1_335 [Xanthomonas phage XaC1]